MYISDDDADDVKSKSAIPANAAKSSCTNSANTVSSDSTADCILVHCVLWSFMAWFAVDSQMK